MRERCGLSKAISVPNFVKISQIAAELWTFSFFQNGGRPPSWILLQVKSDVTTRCGLSISTSLPNLVTVSQITAELLRFSVFQDGGRRHLGFCWIVFSDHRFILLKILRFQVSEIWLKIAYSGQKIGVFGGFRPLNISGYHRDPQKALPCA